MARIIQVTCDGIACLQVIEVADDEDFEIDAALVDLGWSTSFGEDFCPDCSENPDQEYEEDYEDELSGDY